jgi:acyl-CoA synthetase (NDP forming)
MENNQGLLKQLDELFHPRSVAVVGVPREMKSGKIFLMGLMDQGFPGPIYPVHPEAQEIDGLKAYPSITAIPESVDLAIVLVPHYAAFSVIQECAAKGVKGAVLFTAGYKETGTQTGKALENDLVRVARASGMRLIGPNCMGLYSPKSGLSFFPQLSTEPGHVGIISHSGSLTNILGRIASKKGLRFSKVASLGNECDLTSTDFLAYLGEDHDTRLIGAYLEDIKEGPRFLRTLREVSLKKAVILWKAGLTPEGSKAAASHTGAMATSREIWEAVVSQGGAIPVVGFEDWIAALMGFSLLPASLGDRVAIISGPGGLAVSAADACAQSGLKLASISDQTCSALSEFVPPTGTSLHNPIDVGFTAALDINIYNQSAKSAASDPAVDAVMVIGHGLTEETNSLYLESMVKARREFKKPFMVVGIPGFESDLGQRFCRAGIPFFESVERAVATYARVRQYQVQCHARRAQRGG